MLDSNDNDIMLDEIPENDEDVVEVGEFVQGNPQLPSRKTKIKYTPAMMAEIKMSKRDILHFAEKYFYIVNLDRGREKIKLFPAQKKILKSMVEYSRYAITASRQMGKCVCENSISRFKFKPLGVRFAMKIGQFFSMVNAFNKLTRSMGGAPLLAQKPDDRTNPAESCPSFNSFRKFTDVISLRNWQVETERGWEDVESINRTVPYRKFTIRTEGGKELECADNHIVIAENGSEILAKDSLGVTVRTNDGPERIVSVSDDGIEVPMYDLSLPEGSSHCYYTNGILSHNTTLLTIFALHYAIFNNDKTILIVANKEGSAQEVMDRIRLAYEQLPVWLKPGVKTWQKTTIEFLNGSKIRISATSTSAGRGLSINCLIVDECAIIQEHQSAEFFKSVLPTISSSKNSKIILSSTPKGKDNYFYRVVQQAKSGQSQWKYISVPWNMIPGRDEEWKRTAMEDCDNDSSLFEQEYNCKFLSEGTEAIDKDYLSMMEDGSSSPSILDTDDYKVWEEPNQTHLYSIGVDVADGVGECASCVQVLDVTDLRDIRQVACYNNRFIDTSNFAKEINEIAEQWGRPWILLERNNMGAAVALALEGEPFYYPRLVSYDGKSKVDYSKHGIVSSTNVKYDGVANMRYYMNVLKAVRIPDQNTISELNTFVKKPNGTYGKQNGAGIYDDRVMALCWALFLMHKPVAEACMDVTSYDRNGKPLTWASSYEIDDGSFKPIGGLLVPIQDNKPQTRPMYNGYLPYDPTSAGDTYEDLLAAGWHRL